MEKFELGDDKFCFVCGKNNNAGLKLNFKIEENNQIICSFLPQKIHQGFTNIVHGGIIAMILDEAMVNLLWRLGKKAVTAHFEMRFKKPAMVNKELFFKAWIAKEDKKVIYTHSECLDELGQTVALAQAKCMMV